MRTTVAALGLAMTAGMAMAQSVVTLDSFDLGTDETPPVANAESDGMRACLVEGSGCKESGYESGVSISLSDVVNLGIIDSEEIPDDTSVVETAPLPSIDLEILFAYDSDALTPEAMATLGSLSTALSDPRLATARLVFIGHTDSVGGEAYNLDLSRRRADAVARFVMASLAIPPSRIESVGVGYSRLKNTFDPAAAENRRVQLVLIPGT